MPPMETTQLLKSILLQYDFNFVYAAELVSDLNEKQMTSVPSSGLINHPAFTLGHLVSGSALMVEDLGGTFEMLPGWAELFLRQGPGDSRKPEEDTMKSLRKKNF